MVNWSYTETKPMAENESALEKITETLSDVITTIPAPVRKNFLKAVGQLCTSLIDVPVAWLEGKASEIRAANEARDKIIQKQGELITESIDAPEEYVLRASHKYASKIIKEQINLDQITLKAANELANQEQDTSTSKPIKEIEDDWLNEFESHARLKSSEDMKVILGKILAGEIAQPGTFSIKTLRLISQLNNEVAKIFQTLCSLSVSLRIDDIIIDARVISFKGSAASNSLSEYGLAFSNLNILEEYGLIISNYNSTATYNACVADEKFVGITICYQNQSYVLVPLDKEKYEKNLKIDGVGLSRAGVELLKIIPIKPDENYEKAMHDFFEKKGLRLDIFKDFSRRK